MDALFLMMLLFIYTIVFIVAVVFVSLGWISIEDNRFLNYIFKNLDAGCKKFIPTAIKKWTEKAKNFIFYERNPLFQLLYATLLFFGYAAYTKTAFKYVSESLMGRVPYYLLIIHLILFVACCCSDPGVVTRQTVSKYLKDYKYDGCMYAPKDCQTCHLKKPARSKHCSLCNLCIARFDHHCSFLNVCIGRNNHRYFAAFLLSLVLMCGVSSFMIIMVFIHIVNVNELHVANFVDKYGQVHSASLRTVIQYLATSYPLMAILLLFLVCLFVALTCFYLFHVFLIMTNQTTNELLTKRTKNQTQSGNLHRDEQEKKNRHSWKLAGIYSNGLISNTVEVLFPG